MIKISEVVRHTTSDGIFVGEPLLVKHVKRGVATVLSTTLHDLLHVRIERIKVVSCVKLQVTTKQMQEIKSGKMFVKHLWNMQYSRLVRMDSKPEFIHFYNCMTDSEGVFKRFVSAEGVISMDDRDGYGRPRKYIKVVFDNV